MNSAKYIEQLRPLTDTGTMYAVAKLMEVSEDSIQMYVKGTRQMDTFACLRTAELLNLPLEKVIADIETHREKDPKRKKAWAALSKKFLGLALVSCTGSAVLSGYEDTAQAENSKVPGRIEFNHSINYTHWITQVVRWMRAFAGRRQTQNARSIQRNYHLRDLKQHNPVFQGT